MNVPRPIVKLIGRIVVFFELSEEWLNQSPMARFPESRVSADGTVISPDAPNWDGVASEIPGKSTSKVKTERTIFFIKANPAIVLHINFFKRPDQEKTRIMNQVLKPLARKKSDAA
jgi:hypothetical protein